jgi:spermidine synthase
MFSMYRLAALALIGFGFIVLLKSYLQSNSIRSPSSSPNWVEERLAQIIAPTPNFEFYNDTALGMCHRDAGALVACSEDEGKCFRLIPPAVHSESLVHSAMLMHPFPRSVLVVGNGHGTIVREVLRYFMTTSIHWYCSPLKLTL